MSNSLMKPLDPNRMMQYDQIRWVVNGEPFDAEVINRPIYDVVKRISESYYDRLEMASPDGASYVGVTSNIEGVKTVQDFVVHIEENMVPKSRKIIAGTGATGGGDLSKDIIIGMSNVLFTTPETQIVNGTKIFISPPLIRGEIESNDDAITLGYANAELAALAEQSVPATRKVNAGSGLLGGGQLGDDVTINIDPTWVMEHVKSAYDSMLNGLIKSIISEAISDATYGKPVSDVKITGEIKTEIKDIVKTEIQGIVDTTSEVTNWPDFSGGKEP